MDNLDAFLGPWLSSVKPHSNDFPLYPSAEPESLICTSRPVSFQLGTGASIYTGTLLPAMLEAKQEIILVTCFWAPSHTLTRLRDTLQALAELRRDFINSRHSTEPDSDPLPRLRVRICFSSRSFLQKLFHPLSRRGYTYPPAKWASKLGLPDPTIFEDGHIDLQVKTLFFLPFSVMHPKFLIIDRRTAYFPSCNVSWEPWLEACVEIKGEAVPSLLRFYHGVWDSHMEADGRPPIVSNPSHGPVVTTTLKPGEVSSDSIRSPMSRTTHTPTLLTRTLGLSWIESPASRFELLASPVLPTILLPSSHYRNPLFRPLPWQRCTRPPATPLNCALLRLFDMAEKHIYLQTPNLTTPAVMDALLEALDRGVDVRIVTNETMMVWEQLFTAGTTTPRSLRRFIKHYKQNVNRLQRFDRGRNNDESDATHDLEAQHLRSGSLEIFYYHALPENDVQQILEEPVQSHMKLTIVDDDYVVLGSGNMDRASWFTSQELGVLFRSKDVAATVMADVNSVLDGRVTLFFSSKEP
ncbi:hypothetical protein F5Y18DRAFT_420087 [Xylariaceae sp. FL1019]|nr:hypothetical protein F5Y18DRAFT_420087 [Xylariaceae sp. FL1019]